MVLRKLLILLFLGVGVLGCDVVVDPILESTQYYTILGYLDMGRDVHYLRVVPLRPTITPPTDRTLDATVTSIDLTNGNRVVWRDSVIQFRNGSIGHVFYSKFHVEDGHKFRIEVKRSDGKITSAETTVPTRIPTTIKAPYFSIGGSGGLFYEQNVLWKNLAEEPYDVEVWYRYFNGVAVPFTDVKVRYQDFYQTKGTVTKDGLQVTVQLTKDKQKLKEKEIFNTDGQILYGVGMRLVKLDDQWKAPGGVWDPEVLAQPNVFTNVTNGFGFFGSIGQFDVEWVLPESIVRELGYGVPKASF